MLREATFSFVKTDSILTDENSYHLCCSTPILPLPSDMYACQPSCAGEHLPLKEPPPKTLKCSQSKPY